MRSSYHFTSESVSEGHPDKVCDRVSDEVVDLFFREAETQGFDPWQVRVACETLATTNRMVIAGEYRGPGTVTRDLIAHYARMAVKDIGYEQDGFHWEDADIEVLLHAQSADLAKAPNSRANGGAYLGPDAKSQVTVRYENGKAVGVTQIVVSTQHVEARNGRELTSGDVRAIVEPYVRQSLPQGWVTDETVWHVNPTGKFVIGGPDGDCGLTGRKIIVDTYGGAAPHGGGAFSGKDPTKVDRSAAYAARYLAKNVVAAGLAGRCTIQVSYAIGVSKPLSVYFDLHGTGRDVDEEKLARVIGEMVNLSPRGIREHLRMNRPIYAATSAYGHFGRTPDEAADTFTWERTDLAEELKRAFNR